MLRKVVTSREDLCQEELEVLAKTCNLPLDRIEDVYSCTPLQTAIIAESTLHAGASVFQFVLALSESVDQDRFCNAIQRVVSLNAILRTRFVDSSHGMVQVVVKEDHATQHIQDGTDVEQHLHRDRLTSQGLATPLFRTTILGNKLILTIHHGIMDHASLTPLFRDILSVYHATEPTPRAAYKDFVFHSLGIDEDAAKQFWASRFKGAPAIFPKVDSGYTPVGTHSEHRRIKLSQVGSRVSPAHVPSFIEVAWAMTAASYSGNDSVAFGLILSGRNSACPAAETTLGPTIAIVPVQVNLQRSATIETLLKDRATARRQLQTEPSLQYGLTKIRAVSDSAQTASSFQTVLNIRPRWYDSNEASEVTYESMKEPSAAFALVINCDLEDDGVSVEAVVDVKVIPTQQIIRIMNQFEHYIRSLMDTSVQTKIEKLPNLSSDTVSEILQWNGALPDVNEVCLHDLFRSQARQQPAACAVDAWDGNATYKELDDMSDRLSQELRRRGAATGSLVAFVFEKSLWTVVSLLAIMKAGGACVPISTADPTARKKTIMTSVGIKMVLTSAVEYKNCADLAPTVMEVSSATVSALPECTAADQAEQMCKPNELAFVIFTSGSTGMPKGVMLEHRNLASAIVQIAKRLEWQPLHRFFQFASYVWDVHVGETFGALLSGGCLCIASEDDCKSKLASCITSSQIDCMWLTPTVIRTLTPDDVPNLKMLLSVGEPIAPDAASTWGSRLRLVNGWGPCEGSILSAIVELTPDSLYPETIGLPVNCALWLVNPKNTEELVPIGAIGEILIEGPGVARGYLGDDPKTKAVFVKTPEWASSIRSNNEERRFYRTGDLARYNQDGSLCFVGRQDDQVKIRGQRLELGELENTLSACNAVREIFTSTKIIDGRTHLVAVVCFTDTSLPHQKPLQELSIDHLEVAARHFRTIRDHARSNLPSYMVPTVWVAVECMPRTVSDKLDRASVSQWLKGKKDLSSTKAAVDKALTDALTPPRTPEERLMQGIWASVLGVPEQQIGLESCFISLGGDSILAMHTASQSLRQGLMISTSDLLRNASLASILANVVETSSAKDTNDLPPTTSSNQDVASEAMEAVLRRLQDLSSVQTMFTSAIEAAVPVTDGQAQMLAVGEMGGRGYYISFTLRSRSTLDVEKLRTACENVMSHHAILRTVFVRHGSELYQVALKDVPSKSIVETADDIKEGLSFHEGLPLARFHLLHDKEDQGYRGVRLEIHHALYDALSLGHIFRDLAVAYTSARLSQQPQFYSWISHVNSLDFSEARKFWRTQLQDSRMLQLAPVPKGSVRGHLLTQQISFTTPLAGLSSAVPSATPSSVVKAVWALVLSQALGGSKDVMFGEVSANRYISTFPDVEQVQGPCVNQVPVRAKLSPNMTLSALVTQMHYLHISGIPHHHLGTRSIVRECTDWPPWTRFSTAFVYQNHDSISKTMRIGDVDCDLSVQGELGDSTDIHVIAQPDSTQGTLEVGLRYSPLTFSPEQISWLSQCFSEILSSFPKSLEHRIDQIEAELSSNLGPSPFLDTSAHDGEVIVAPTSSMSLQDRQNTSTSEIARDIVSETWNLLGLAHDKEEPKGQVSMWDAGADVVTALLLAEQYRVCGYCVTPLDIVQNHTREMQQALIESKSMADKT